MTAMELAKELKLKMKSQLDELGVEGFVLMGYVKDGDGKINRFAVANSGDNPAVEDGLRQIVAFANVWTQPTPRPGAEPQKPAVDL